jgi:hypothetical protein
MVKESIKWMTRRGKSKASFKEFAEACGLDYVLMKGGVQMKTFQSWRRMKLAGSTSLMTSSSCGVRG